MSRTFNTIRMGKFRVLVGLAILVAVATVFAQQPAPAAAYENRLAIECNDNPVSEGDTFRLHMVKDYKVSTAPIS